MPVGAAARRGRRLGSWDRMVLPWPGTTIAFVVGTPIAVPPDATPEAIESARAALESALQQATAEAAARVGAAVDAPSRIADPERR